MNSVLLILLLLIDPTKISEVNKAKEKAKESYARGEYKEAAAQYRTLVDSLGVKEEEVSMNMAHSYYHINDTIGARNAYLGLTNSTNTSYKSVSYQQLGMLSHREGKLEEALSYFKSSLKANPLNEDSRLNYELVKKKLDEKKRQEEEQKRNQSMKPSEYAKKLKAEADKLVARREYQEAYNLMAQGLKVDKTVAHYTKFIERTKEVAEIK